MQNTRASRRRTANGWLGSIKRVGQLADVLLDHLPQRPRSVFRHRVPRQQRHHMWHQRARKELVVVTKDRQNPVAIAGTQRENLLDLRIRIEQMPMLVVDGSTGARLP